MLVTTLAMVCPFEVPEKQALLEAPTPADRAAMLVALMQHGRARRPPPGMPPPAPPAKLRDDADER